MSSNYWRRQPLEGYKPKHHYVSNKHKKTNETVSGFEKLLNDSVDSYTLADHPELVPLIFNRLGVEGYYTFFLEHGYNKKPGTYHGLMHSLQTALNCYEGGLYAHLNNSELKTLVVAGLYHDARHSQGMHSDRFNVQEAIRALETAHDFTPEHQRLKKDELAAAIEAIKLTEYPYKAKKTSSTLGRVLRDADMMALYTTDPDDLLDLFLGLINEINLGLARSHMGGHDYADMSIDAFCEQQARFVTGLEWNTSWGKLKAFTRNWPQAGRRLNHLLQLAKQQQK